MQQLTREQYKMIKRMDKAALVAYLGRVYLRGYNAGKKAAIESGGEKTSPPEESKDEVNNDEI